MSKEATPGTLDNGKSPSVSASASTSVTQISRPFFTLQEISYLHSQTIPSALKLQYATTKQQIYQFLNQVVKLLKFPIRVLATTMNYYQRFYLFNKFEVATSAMQIENSPYTIAMTCLFLASKVEDCIKKLKDIQQVCNKLRDINENTLVESNGSGFPFIDLQRKIILSTEFKLLQITKFDFNLGNNPSFAINVDDLLIQFCKNLAINYKISMLSWLINYDIIQTPLSLVVPPHCIALAIIIISLNLNPAEMNLQHHEIGENDEQEVVKIKKILSGLDCSDFQCPEVLVNEAILYILDYYTHQYDNSVLQNYLPPIDQVTGKNQIFKFLDLKQKFNDVEILNERSCNFKLNEKDGYLKNWDYGIATKGLVRFMLSNKRSRFNNEQETKESIEQEEKRQRIAEYEKLSQRASGE
ncbi:CTK2 [Candida margitis]|uniref:CTK2 n=1 Tax=Candida margitis TaxID=1775924 RepID=UPI002225E6D8|nr:CTK2 [Candida margitis]KAI5950312.1 CTK2 [Candida margitis]